MRKLSVSSVSHSQAINITRQVSEVVRDSEVQNGWCTVFVRHTTAAVLVNEAADSDVMTDVLKTLDKMVPWNGDYRHNEGNSAAHIKSILVGSSLRLPVQNGNLDLGTWQGVFFMEFDGPRNRQFVVDVV